MTAAGASAALMLLVSAATANSSATSGGTIASSRDGDVWVMDADGTNVRRLTTNPAEDFDPSLSPDGTQVAFRSHRDGVEEVYVMNIDGSGQRNLTRNPGTDYSPAWSPDGSTIAFKSDRGGRQEIWLIDPDGRNPRELTDRPGINEYPTWSPDGTRIAFHCSGGRVLPQGGGDFEICVVNVATGRSWQITNGRNESTQPSWSRDGSRIAFQSDREGWPCGINSPAYSPDRPGEWELYSVKPDGTGLLRLTDDPRHDQSFPTWSPDGSRILFSQWGKLLTIAPDGSSLEQLAPGAVGQFPDWVDPGASLVERRSPASGSPAAQRRVRLVVTRNRKGALAGRSDTPGTLRACAGRRLVASARVRGGRWRLPLAGARGAITITHLGDARHVWTNLHVSTRRSPFWLAQRAA